MRASGRLYEGLVASRLHRPPLNLFHSALIVQLSGHPYAIEMAPVWAMDEFAWLRYHAFKLGKPNALRRENHT